LEEKDDEIIKVLEDNNYNYKIDKEITIKEIKKAIKKFKNKKSPGKDKITNKMMKCFNDEIC